MQNNHFDVIIIGAGAAGLMCAQLAGQFGQKVLILDHSKRLAEKIRISGGGRCNFTNIYAAPECYISQNRHYVTSALSRYTPHHFTEMLDYYNLSYHEKTLGQLFCDEKSQAIIDLLDFLCRENNVKRLMETSVLHVEHSNSGYIVDTSNGQYHSAKLVIATGGLSIPQIGATDFGYQIGRNFGMQIITPTPALVPLTLSAKDLTRFSSLAGISFLSETNIDKVKFLENSLFTHRGLSGPAILQISSYWNNGVPLNINMLPHTDIRQEILVKRSSNKLVSNFLASFFSQRLADSICKLVQFDKPLSQLTNKEIDLLTNLIHNFKITPNGSEGFKKAEVTKGGIDTTCLNSKTMMAKNINGLYFIGEVVDVTGWLGGYNFQWAWSSAYAAATSF